MSPKINCDGLRYIQCDSAPSEIVVWNFCSWLIVLRVRSAPRRWRARICSMHGSASNDKCENTNDKSTIRNKTRQSTHNDEQIQNYTLYPSWMKAPRWRWADIKMLKITLSIWKNNRLFFMCICFYKGNVFPSAHFFPVQQYVRMSITSIPGETTISLFASLWHIVTFRCFLASEYR